MSKSTDTVTEMRKKERKRQLTYRLVGSALLCASLFFATVIMGKADVADSGVDFKAVGLYLCASTFLMGVYEILSFVHHRAKGNGYAFFHLIYAALFVSAGVCAFCARFANLCFYAGGIVCLLVPVCKRVASMLANHTKRNVVSNALVGAVNILLVVLAVSSLGMQELGDLIITYIVSLVMLITCLFGVGALALSNFNVELLKKIIRKTYAGEIMFGLLLLIVAFSMTLTMVESDFTRFGDALWYCFAIVTTIGFGDFAATTLLGRVLSVVLGVYGLVVVSIITSIIVNFYNEVKSEPEADEVPPPADADALPQEPAPSPTEQDDEETA